MKRLKLSIIGLLVLTMAACFSSPTTPTPTPKVQNGVYVGQISDSDALIALLIEDGKATLYTCGGEESWQYLTGWFESNIVNNNLSANDTLGLELSGSFDGQRWLGSLSLRGKTHSWQAVKALSDRPAGLFVLNTASREAGLIIDNTLATAGVYYGKSSGQTATVRVEQALKVGSPASSLEIFTEAYGGSKFALQQTARPLATPRPTPDQLLRQAVARVYPDMKDFRLIKFDDRAIVSQLKTLATASAANPELATKPTAITLPIVDADGKVTSYPWTVYHHNVRAESADFGLYILDLERKTTTRLEQAALRGPSFTFQGVPNLSAKDFTDFVKTVVASGKAGEALLSDEKTYQASDVSIINNQLSASYAGNNVQYPSVLEGLKTTLYMHYPVAQVDSLLGQATYTYLLYNQLHYLPERVHGYPENQASILTPQETIKPLGHFEDEEFKAELLLVPIMDATIFTASTNTWLIPEAHAYAESAVNKQNSVWQWTAISMDQSGEISNSSLSVKTTIHQFVGLSGNSLSQLDPDNSDHYPADSCRDEDDDGKSFIQNVANVFAGLYDDDNMYKLLWTNAYGGGCAWAGTLNSNPKFATGWVGMKDSTMDFIKETQVHESGHIVGGTHAFDEFGSSGETTHLHRCKLLGIAEIGHEGPSLLSYNRTNPHTLCFAYPTESGTPEKNLTKVAKFLHNNLVTID